MIERAEREAHLAADRRDVDDDAALVRPEMRQNGFGGFQQTNHVHVELTPDLIHRRSLKQTIGAIAGVVQQDVDRAEPLFGRRDRRVNLVAIGDVKREGNGTIAVGRDDILDGGRVPRGHRHSVASRQGGQRDLAAESGGTPGDEPGRWVLGLCAHVSHLRESAPVGGGSVGLKLDSYNELGPLSPYTLSEVNSTYKRLRNSYVSIMAAGLSLLAFSYFYSMIDGAVHMKRIWKIYNE